MIELLSINKIANELRSVTINEICGHLKLKDIKNNLVTNYGKPDLLIGVKDFWRFFIKKTEISKGCYLVNTTIGSVICGENQKISLEKTIPVQTHVVVKSFEEMPSESEIKSWWDLQSIGITENPEENEDETAQELFNKSIRQVDGRYRVKWLWKDEIPDLPTNYGIAYKCLESLLNRLQNEQGLENLKRIDKTIQDQLKLGIIEEAFKSKGELEHYLPHRPVFKDDKIREVYNASARSKGHKSLNDCLFRGPLKLPDLAGMIMRFRLSKFPLLADIEKAFLQIELEEVDREVTKFLWLKDINKPLKYDNLIIYRFTRVAFGIICSPSLLAMTIEHHLNKFPGYEKLFKNIYVDNVFIDCSSEEEVFEKYIDLKKVFSEGKMNLREFVTNARKALEKIPEIDKLTDLNQKVLGINWDIKMDNLEIKFPCSNLEDKFTRRKVLEIMASLFDPLGLVSPCLVNPKLLFQKLWDKPKNWDEELEITHSNEWINILNSWKNQKITVPRLVIIKNCKYQLHVFVDANKDTYAAVIYLRSKENDNVKVSLIYSRNRIRSKKQNLTIPRMELLALLIGTRAIKFVEKELQIEIEKKFIWSDAKVVLLWLNTKEKQPRFVENRLAEIRKNTDIIFKYVSTNENPSDVCTRGSTPEELRLNDLWWNGPIWLSKVEENWPNDLEIKIEIKSLDICETPITMSIKNTGINLIKFERFSNWQKLIKVMIIVLKFLREKFKLILKNDKWENKLLFLSKDKIEQTAENLLIKIVQKEKIDEFNKWEIFEDKIGIKRLKSRIKNSDANFELENPIIIPKNSEILPLLINNIHEKFKHVGVQSTLVEFLSKFWTPQSRRKVKETLKKCLKCRKMKSSPFMLPKFPNLPIDRIQSTSPFKSIGIDHLGPSLYREIDNKEKKFWITLITCLCTRAVYLEPVKNLKADTCLNVLKRLAARRGCPERILSDNSKTFIACAKNCKVHLKIIGKELEWKFIKELSPWQGGVYERIVALVKDAFRKTLGKRTLQWEEMITFTTEVEGILNMRL
uniref:Integrase catalytic domain-containing protein n=1 Tax=Meloidogyne enterolobii TaxID=390850 RepID=A0A6V7XZV5_MELEN|nr:unnamed protein product [Meloidogyne enterolobii]